MRTALVFMCGLGILAAASATVEESRLGIRDSRFATRNAEAMTGSSDRPISDVEPQATSHAAPGELADCQEITASLDDVEAVMPPADVTR